MSPEPIKVTKKRKVPTKVNKKSTIFEDHDQVDSPVKTKRRRIIPCLDSDSDEDAVELNTSNITEDEESDVPNDRDDESNVPNLSQPTPNNDHDFVHPELPLARIEENIVDDESDDDIVEFVGGDLQMNYNQIDVIEESEGINNEEVQRMGGVKM